MYVTGIGFFIPHMGFVEDKLAELSYTCYIVLACTVMAFYTRVEPRVHV